jgi:hypothetical protein
VIVSDELGLMFCAKLSLQARSLQSSLLMFDTLRRSRVFFRLDIPQQSYSWLYLLIRLTAHHYWR